MGIDRLRAAVIAVVSLFIGLIAGAGAAGAQIIIGGGTSSGGIIVGGGILFGPPIPARPPLAAFHATIANAGPRTSSGLIIYETPGLIWTCEATNCGSQGRLNRLNMETCAALGRQVGQIVALEAAGRGFSPEGIAACNNAVVATPQPGIAPPASQGIAPPNANPPSSGGIRFPGQ